MIAQCPKYDKAISTNESLMIATVDPSFVEVVRKRMPVLEHRRDDIYSLTLANKVDSLKRSDYLFANIIISASIVFYQTKFSYAFTNIRCVVPGRKYVLLSVITCFESRILRCTDFVDTCR